MAHYPNPQSQGWEHRKAWLCSGIVPTPVSCPIGGQLKECTDSCLCFSHMWPQMLYLTLRGETLQLKCGHMSGVCMCACICECGCAPMYLHVETVSQCQLKVAIKHFICVGNQGHHMFAFLGLPNNYINIPRAKRAGSGQPSSISLMRNAEEGLTLRRTSLPAHGMFPASGFKQRRYSEVECSVESNLSPCFVLGTYQGEP